MIDVESLQNSSLLVRYPRGWGLEKDIHAVPVPRYYLTIGRQSGKTSAMFKSEIALPLGGNPIIFQGYTQASETSNMLDDKIAWYAPNMHCYAMSVWNDTPEGWDCGAITPGDVELLRTFFKVGHCNGKPVYVANRYLIVGDCAPAPYTTVSVTKHDDFARDIVTVILGSEFVMDTQYFNVMLADGVSLEYSAEHLGRRFVKRKPRETFADKLNNAKLRAYVENCRNDVDVTGSIKKEDKCMYTIRRKGGKLVNSADDKDHRIDPICRANSTLVVDEKLSDTADIRKAAELLLRDAKVRESGKAHEARKKAADKIREIDHVIYNDPATIVFYKDGTKSVVKRLPGDEYDPLVGLLLAIVKHEFGGSSAYYEVVRKFLPGKPSEEDDV